MTTKLAIEDLETTLGLTFNDRGLLRQALVHRSYLNEHDGSSLDSYERMEFLGDAVLELIVSTELYQSLPYVNEGELTKVRSSLVCRPSLAKAARRLELGSYLALGKGEAESGGHNKDPILEEAFESVVAAIYLDQGYDAARRFALRALEPELSEFCRRGKSPENPKSRLQELVQGLGQPTPTYRVVATDGPDHQPVFTVAVLVGEDILGQGTGRRKSDAERVAAQLALEACEAAPAAGLFANPAAESGKGRPAGSKGKSRNRQRESICSHSSKETGKATRKRRRRESGEVGNAGSGVFSAFSAPLTLMRRFGKNSRKS